MAFVKHNFDEFRLSLKHYFMGLLWFSISSAIGQNLENIMESKPISMSSGLSLSTSFYNVQGSDFRQQPFNYALSGTPTLSIYGFNIPLSFYYSNQGLSYHQPFNQFGMSPEYKWAKLHLGHSSVNFSDYTLAGRRFLGVGTELNPGKLRVGFVYGRFQEAIEQDSIFRRTPGSFLGEFPIGAYERKAFAAKLGLGTERNFFDIIFMQGADDTTSLNLPTSINSVIPESNMVIGFKNKFHFTKFLFWESDVAGSYFTRNIRSEQIDTVSFLPRFGGEEFQPKNTSQLLFAGNALLGLHIKHFRLGLRYRRIARDYKTFGAYYFQTDIEEYNINTSMNLMKNKVNLRGSIGFQNDNLDGTRIQTTSRIVGSANIGWQINTKLRIDGMMTNFGIQQRNALTGLLDSVRIDQVANSYQFQGRYTLGSHTRPQALGISSSIQSLAPRTRDLVVIVDTRAYQNMLYYNYMIPVLRLGLTANIHSMVNVMEVGTSMVNGGGINGSYGLKSGKVNFNMGCRYFVNSFAKQRLGNTISLDGGLSANITAKWNNSIQFRYLSTTGGLNDQTRQFSEFFVQINSNFSF